MLISLKTLKAGMPAMAVPNISEKKTCNCGQTAAKAVRARSRTESHQLKARVMPLRARSEVASGEARIQTSRE